MSLTSITLSGTVKKNAEQRHTPNGNSVISVMMNVTKWDGRAKEEKQYPVKVNLWGDNNADLLEKLTEGTKIIATGRLQIDQFNDRNGKMVKLLCIEASAIRLATDLVGAAANTASSSSPYDASVEQSSSYTGSETDGFSNQEVPF